MGCSVRSGGAAVLLAVLLGLTNQGCSTPLGLKNLCGVGLVEGWIQPFVGGTSTLDARPALDLVGPARERVAGLRVGVLRNPARASWSATIDGEVREVREDENALLADFLRSAGIFKEVTLIDRLDEGVDWAVSLSAECIYEQRTDGWAYALNILPFCGLGFLLGFPYEYADAVYVGQAVFYDCRGDHPEISGGGFATTYRQWPAINLYYTPAYYSAWNLRPVLAQILQQMLAHSGCMEGAEQ